MAKRYSIGSVNRSPIFKMIMAVMPFGLLILGVLYFGKPILEAIKKLFSTVGNFTDTLGLTKSDSEQTVDSESVSSVSPFSPSYYKIYQKNHKATLLTNDTADRLAAMVYNSVDMWSPSDFTTCFGAIKQCKYKTQVSYLSDRFFIKYNKDMLTHLKGGLFYGFTSDQIAQMLQYSNSLPASA